MCHFCGPAGGGFASAQLVFWIGWPGGFDLAGLSPDRSESRVRGAPSGHIGLGISSVFGGDSRSGLHPIQCVGGVIESSVGRLV